MSDTGNETDAYAVVFAAACDRLASVLAQARTAITLAFADVTIAREALAAALDVDKPRAGAAARDLEHDEDKARGEAREQ